MKNIQKTVFKVGDFLSWQRAGSLILSPHFQRRPVWPRGAKSYLIDTIVRGIPMPIIFLRERTDPKSLEPRREVVDGQQRLRTVIGFVEPALLGDFDEQRDGFTVQEIHNPDLAGKRYREFDAETKRAILDYEFSVQVLPAGTEDREVLQIFARMNSTGLALNKQELRNAEYFGAFKSTMYRLAYEQLDRWRSWHIFSEIDIARMIEVEETSDMVITMMQGVHARSHRLLGDYYKKYDQRFPVSSELSRRFQCTMDAIEDQLGRDIPGLAFRRRPLFHTLFTFYYDLQFGLDSGFAKARARAVPTTVAQAVRQASTQIASGTVPEDLARVLRGATGHLPARRRRLAFLWENLTRLGQA